MVSAAEKRLSAGQESSGGARCGRRESKPNAASDCTMLSKIA